jgi:predicted RNA-binding Zn-ribbon protein involved in translation (DUF1610 family)
MIQENEWSEIEECTCDNCNTDVRISILSEEKVTEFYCPVCSELLVQEKLEEDDDEEDDYDSEWDYYKMDV